jgi:hypothetical protein
LIEVYVSVELASLLPSIVINDPLKLGRSSTDELDWKET